MHVTPEPETPGTPVRRPEELPTDPVPETPGSDPDGRSPQVPPPHPDDPEDDGTPLPDTPEALVIRIP